MTTDTPSRRIKSVKRACALLMYLREVGPSTVTELATEFNLSAGTVHAYLATLREAGFVKQEENEYALGPELLPLGEHVRIEHSLYQAARGEVDRLAYATGGVAHLLTEYDGQLLVLYEAFGENAIGRDFHAQKRDQPQEHTHCTAGGKAILARFPERRVRMIAAEHGLPKFTENTVTDLSELVDELAEIREQGYAINDQEQMRGIRAVGAPVIDSRGGIIGAVSVSGAASNWRGSYFRDELPELVTRAATNIEINLQANGDQ
ncbi:IclR family transcriptional regulator [Natronorubrum sp. FCH18a]|uniref:IclR family transcriptional regulator n=1 Tax=Natronorubrum sp. FCH18a TaxID=3447018 RepID=UPI003F5179A3